MAADSDRVVFRNQWIWPRVHGRANACDSFIYKRATDVIRISFNTLHLLFTSCTPCIVKADVRLRLQPCLVPFCLSIPLCRTDVSLCLTSGLLVERLSLRILDVRADEISKKVSALFRI